MESHVATRNKTYLYPLSLDFSNFIDNNNILNENSRNRDSKRFEYT